MLNGLGSPGNAGAEPPERVSASDAAPVEEVRFDRSGLVPNPVEEALNLIRTDPIRSGIRRISRVHRTRSGPPPDGCEAASHPG
jgi:hypothetical protein